ncbi:hypothetical protein OG765_00940 [Streptomyces sp. NBC_00555]|uniref:hypothetical protein n=1 Tax=Streptomyces sp. NBC_00555 TaxID=2903662 RepID=UPI002253F76E|nr:hypothetical protein [Streptomyces sp. NBC_00555]MCX5009564.1 hypothetical protein [Streptomyces sp. NBC_00555]
MTMQLRADGRSLCAASFQPCSHLFVVRAVLAGQEFASRGHGCPKVGWGAAPVPEPGFGEVEEDLRELPGAKPREQAAGIASAGTSGGSQEVADALLVFLKYSVHDEDVPKPENEGEVLLLTHREV